MSYRTPAQIEEFLSERLHRMDMPVQYLGDEPNSRRRDWDSSTVRWLLAASWPYEHASGNQSIPAVYGAIQRCERFLADRWYLPATPRDFKAFEDKGIPVFGVESRHQMADFDVVATSIAYPVLVISFCHYLKVSDIPLRRRDRDPNKAPFIVVGGQAYGAPEVLSPIVDAIWCGEVEDEPGNPGIVAVSERIEEFKALGMWTTERVKCYEYLAKEFDFLYFPQFVDVHYAYEDRRHVGLEEPSLQVSGYTRALEGMKLPVLKRYVKDLDAVPPMDDAPLLYAHPSMGSGDLEVARGCPAWCSFCALTYRQKPYRQRSVPYMVDYARGVQENMGGKNFVPFSPDFPMHTQRNRLVKALLEVGDEVEGGAMRVDDFIADPSYILLQVFAGMDGVTLGVEGNSQRMRDLVGKGASDEDIKEAVVRGIQAGIRKFKFFMISNLPGEDEGDVFQMYRLALDLADIRDSMGAPNVRFQFSWTPLLIEANTPMQWFAPTTSVRALGDVWEGLRDIGIDFKLGTKAEPNKATFFQMCQRASRRIGEVLIDVADSLNQACWGGVPKRVGDLIESGMREAGFLNGIQDAYDERFKHDLFGWEFIDQGVNPELLWVTYVQMREFIEETDSHTYDEGIEAEEYHGNEWVERCDTKCYGKTCGVCDVQDLKLRQAYIRQRDETYDLANVKVIDQSTMAMKVRVKVTKDLSHRYVMVDHWPFQFRRAAVKAGVPLTKRHVRFSSAGIKFKNWSTGTDYLEFGVTTRATRATVQEWVDRINAHMRGMTLGEFILLPATADSLRSDVDLALWELEVDSDPETMARAIRDFQVASYVPLTLRMEAYGQAPTTKEVNAKDLCDDLWLVRDGHRVKVRMLLRGAASPYDLWASVTKMPSYLPLLKYAARCVDVFIDVESDQTDFLRPTCQETGRQIPVTPLDIPFDLEFSPRARDRHDGRLVYS